MPDPQEHAEPVHPQVGLKGILRGGQAAAFPAQGFQMPEFMVPGREPSQDEQQRRQEVESLRTQLAQAERRAEQYRLQIEERERKAYEKGLQEGKTKGVKDGEASAKVRLDKEIARLKGEVQSVLAELPKQQAEEYALLREAALQLSLALMRRLHCLAVVEDPEVLRSTIAEAFRYLGQDDDVVVHLHPLDAPSSQADGFWTGIVAGHSVTVVEDAAVGRGGCVLESAAGSVDLRTQTMLDRLESAVLGAWKRRPEQS